MDTRYNMIIIKGEIKTSEIMSCQYNGDTKKWDVKSQTILNIISNILLQGKTVQVVSNNNSATENVYEKLSSPKYNLEFIAATLGSSKNRQYGILIFPLNCDKLDKIYKL